MSYFDLNDSITFIRYVKDASEILWLHILNIYFAKFNNDKK